MKRRNFLAGLASIPFIGKAIKAQPPAPLPDTHTLTVDEMPLHDHRAYDHAHAIYEPTYVDSTEHAAHLCHAPIDWRPLSC